jgi:hypothetical protein
LLVLALMLAAPAVAAAQGASIRGVVVAAADDQPIFGVTVQLTSTGGGRARTTVSAADGEFVFGNLGPGEWELRVSQTGFEDLAARLTLGAGQTRTVRLALVVAPRRETVSVQGDDPVLVGQATTETVVPATLADVAPLAGDRFADLLPVLPGVIRRPDGRLSLSGGRPDQSGLQVSDVNVTDPVTGDYGIEMPVDAVASVTRFTSPYAAEYGRFSSGVVRIETRRADNEWRASVTNFLPIPRIRDGRMRGLSSFSPRAIVGGPLVPDRVFISQSAEYETRKIKVPALPDGDNDREVERITAFTRFDAELADGHDLTTTFALFRGVQRFVTLDTFNPLPVTPDVRERGFELDVKEQAVVGPDLLISSQVSFRRYDVDVESQIDGPMVLTPDGRQGAFFHRQVRDSRSFQWIESVTRSVSSRAGTHLVKAGLDLLHTRYQGTVDNQDVEIRDREGRLLESVAFPGSASLSTSALDVAVFAQDRWRVSDRLLVELGLRLDRDGVLERASVSPRAGAAFSVLANGRGIVRGGGGVFAGRTPLNVATFAQLEHRVVTSYLTDGLAPASPPQTYDHELRIGETPRGLVWSIGYDHRLSPRTVARVQHLRRRSRHEFVLSPQAGATGPSLVLTSDGESNYKETEITLAYDGPEGLEAIVSYVNARAEGDFNQFDRYFGDLPAPVIVDAAEGLFDVDVPHRLLFRGILPLSDGLWQIAPLIEVRSGFPFSSYDVRQRLVGAPNSAGRFPVLATVDLAVSRLLTIFGRRVLVGVRGYNLFNRFTPRDVQTSLASPDFGGFSNGIERRIGFLLQLNPPVLR